MENARKRRVNKLVTARRKSFVVHIKTDDIYKDIAEDVDIRFNAPNYKLKRTLPKRKNKELTGLIKFWLGDKIETKCVRLRAKTYCNLLDDDSEDKKIQRWKKICYKKNLNLKIIQTV